MDVGNTSGRSLCPLSFLTFTILFRALLKLRPWNAAATEEVSLYALQKYNPHSHCCFLMKYLRSCNLSTIIFIAVFQEYSIFRSILSFSGRGVSTWSKDRQMRGEIICSWGDNLDFPLLMVMDTLAWMIWLWRKLYKHSKRKTIIWQNFPELSIPLVWVVQCFLVIGIFSKINLNSFIPVLTMVPLKVRHE